MTPDASLPRRLTTPVAISAAILLATFACQVPSRETAIAGRSIDVLLEERFTLGRLADQTAWQGCVAVDSTAVISRVACGDAPSRGSTRFSRIERVARDLRAVISTDSTPGTLRARALLDLAWQDSSSTGIERAVASLERARQADSTRGDALNDLAVAYLELGQRTRELQPMLRALDAVERALERDSALAAALFNRAIILDRLYMLASARQAWLRYLEVERDQRWRKEAEFHARRLASANERSWEDIPNAPSGGVGTVRAEVLDLARRSPQDARERAFMVLRDWGDAMRRGDWSRSLTALATVREIGLALDALDADRSVSLALRAIDSLAPDSVRSRALATAHVDLGEGFALYGRAAFNDGVAYLARAEEDLRRFGSPAARWAAYYRAASAVELADFADADYRFRRILGESTPLEPGLRGKTVWALGVSQLRRGNYENAIVAYRAAKEHIVRAREPDNEGAISYLLAEAFNLAGQSPSGRAEAYNGLELLSPYRRSNHLNNHLTTVAILARRDGLSHAAVSIMQEVLDVARRIGRPQVLAWAHRAHARELMMLGRPAAAREALAEASRWVDSIRAGSGRDRVRADIELVRAQLARAENPHHARTLLASVVAAYDSLRLYGHLASALYEMAIATKATGDRTGAQGTLDRAIDAIERQSRTFTSAEVRATFAETVERVFDTMMDLQFESDRPDSAFSYLERGRAAAWPVKSRAGVPGAAEIWPSLAQVRAVLPPDMIVVEYALLRDRLAIWTISNTGWRPHLLEIRRDSVARLVDRYLREASESRTDSGSARAQLFEILVRPLADDLNGVRRIAVIPDRELSRLPFGGLWDRRSRRYLVENVEVRTPPSAAFLVAASGRSIRWPAGGQALVVGNPSLDTASSARLRALPGALHEAETVAKLYRRARLLTRDEARRATVVKLLEETSVFHFAGHAIANADQPELSYLALASDAETEGGDDGTLRGQEIGNLRLSNLQLAVLSACSTLNPRPSHTGPIAGLAYSFLRAGVPATISTLWDVSDDVTTDLLVEFHRHFARGVAAPEALRLAQQQALRSERAALHAPGAWAAFIYTGP